MGSPITEVVGGDPRNAARRFERQLSWSQKPAVFGFKVTTEVTSYLAPARAVRALCLQQICDQGGGGSSPSAGTGTQLVQQNGGWFDSTYREPLSRASRRLAPAERG
jgi:hypothetical protein